MTTDSNKSLPTKDEYIKRKEEQIRLINEISKVNNVDILDCDYDNDIYHEKIKGTEEEKEGGSRCTLCFMLRLTKTAKLAKENNFDYFGTTLTVSPHKNSELINKIGFKEAEKEKAEKADFGFINLNISFNSSSLPCPDV